ncbi:MATE family efflux transporter [Brucepastera parasyntrophica]|uniref:MATE family efflux transporter n=1 Tax=Brucepastera parasyntrophica TaxID=2880008 RepID=UPI00210E775D|nr:MATE family efflux transporter [Brucepastera parasyntrophica]ULQ60502.1 MATE family efflux transporter [Brucepastera parasyntrophica]
MNQKNANDFLEKEKLGRLMRKFAVPCIISLLVAALYNIVDQIFIANADYLGSYGNAANTVVFPLTVVALAIAVMIGDGCCAFVSISLGAKEDEKAHHSIGNSIVLTVASSLVITAVYLFFRDPILTMFGGRVNQETFNLSKEYFTYIAIGIPFFMFGQAMNPIIRSDGSPRFAMVSTLAGAILNVILDPIFIFVFRWGMMGAAVATVLGQVLTAVLAVMYLFRMKATRLRRSSFRLSGSLMGKFLPLGICSFLSQISLVAAMAAINNMIHKYGAMDAIFGQPQYAQIPMAVVGIVMKFFQIVISVVVGMAAGCIPIVGYNMGAERYDRARGLFTRLLIAETCVGIAALLAVELFLQQLLSIFGAANESIYYTQFGVKAFRIYLCMVVPACINKAAFIFLQSMGKPWVSTFLSMLREVIFGVGLALLLPVFWGLDGVLYSMPAADILTFTASVIVIVNTYKTLGKHISPAAEDLADQNHGQQITEGVSPVNAIITIGRSFGSGGRTVGKLLAERLNIPYYDKEILTAAAESSGLNEKYIESIDERSAKAAPIRSFSGDAGYGSMEEIAHSAQREAIEQAAQKGACVIVGRRSDRILKEAYDVFSVFITAPFRDRIKRVAGRDRIPEEECVSVIKRMDRERAAYYNQLSSEKWNAASTYNLCIDTGKLGIDGAVSSVIHCLKIMGKVRTGAENRIHK